MSYLPEFPYFLWTTDAGEHCWVQIKDTGEKTEVSRDLPSPNDTEQYYEAIAKKVVSLIHATNGHTAVLFTSYRALQRVYELAKPELRKYDVIHMTRGNKTAIDSFRTSENGVLFASGCIWEGVDCAGDCLSSVIIVRLPFPRRSAIMELKCCGYKSRHELNSDSAAIAATAQGRGCQIEVMRYQQQDGLNTALPFGVSKHKYYRTMDTECASILVPFRVQEIQHPNGILMGVNTISKNLILVDRKRLTTPHGFFLGYSGGGKSAAMKINISRLAAATDDDIIIIDAEREYGRLTKALGGEILEISPNSNTHINPLDVADGFDDENVAAAKSRLITCILEQQAGEGRLDGVHTAIIDRCTNNIYRRYLKDPKNNPMPLLSDWRAEVMRQPEPEARELALISEYLTEGSMNVFSHPTNVEMNNRIVTLDLYEMGEQLRPSALVVALEAVQNRVVENRRKGKYTWVFIEEAYLYFKYQYSADILYKAFKRWRKYYGILTAATQNVEECLNSEAARLMLANSDFLMLFSQAPTDQKQLAELLNISKQQLGYVQDVEPGTGLMKCGSMMVPFTNQIPTDSELYKLITTKPSDGIFGDDRNG